MFVSVDGKAKEVTEIFAGGQDGKAHRITEMFGSVDGVAKLLFTSEKETNAFDQFTWAEIKQLANEGKLLEHFNKYDRVTIKFKTPLVNNDFKMYLYEEDGTSNYTNVPQVQTEMMFHIVEVTESKMRLMSPRVSVLGNGNSVVTYKSKNLKEGDKMYYFAKDWEDNNSSTFAKVGEAWGMTEMYQKLKIIENSLPDDLRNVLSVCTRPMITYTKNSITNATVTEYDEDMRIRQVSDNVFSKSVDTSNPDIIYPVINESYYPTLIGEYLRYIYIPEKYDNYEQRKKLVDRMAGLRFMNHTRKRESSTVSYVHVSYTNAPRMSCFYSKGITTSSDYNSFTASNAGEVSKVLQDNISPYCNVIFPEILIEADVTE